MYLAARALVADEGEDVVAGDGEPHGGGRAEHHAVGLPRVAAAVHGHAHAHVVAGGAAHVRPLVVLRRRHARAEAAHHALRQLHHAPPTFRRHCQLRTTHAHRSITIKKMRALGV